MLGKIVNKMKGRAKEEEKNEKVFRNLLKLPANCRCINCNTLGPLYVCTTFRTFVCSTCSRIHREFSHRVKSVSKSTFTSEEVAALQRGGNERAMDVYFKEWDSARQSVPSDVDKLRRFIKDVYVDRRFTGEKTVDRKDSFKDSCIERSRYGGRGVEKDSRNNHDEGRNPGDGKDQSQKQADRRRIAAYFEENNDIFRGRVPETTKSEAICYSNRKLNPDRKLSNRYKALDSSRLREVRSLREILDKIPSMKQNAALKEDDKRLNSMGHEKNTCSDHEPASKAQQLPKSTSQSASKQPNSPNSSARSDCSPEGNQPKTGSNAKNMDSVVSAAKAMGGELIAEIPNMGRIPSNTGASPTAALSNVSNSAPAFSSPTSEAALSNVSTSATAFSSPTSTASLIITACPLNTSEANHVKQEQGVLQLPCSTFPITAIQSTNYMPSGNPYLQPQQIPQTSSGVVSKPFPSEKAFNGKKESLEGHGTNTVLHSGPSNQNSCGRKELSEHLFTGPVTSASWQPVLAHGTGYGLQYSSPMQVSTVYHQPANLTNNLGCNNWTHLRQSPMLSSMDSNSFGRPSTRWMPTQSSAYSPAVPFQPPSSTSGMPSSSYMGQQLPNNLPFTGYQNVQVLGNNPAVFGTSNTGQQTSGHFATPAIQRSFPSGGGNPFA